jgi:hypothetical protein
MRVATDLDVADITRHRILLVVDDIELGLQSTRLHWTDQISGRARTSDA